MEERCPDCGAVLDEDEFGDLFCPDCEGLFCPDCEDDWDEDDSW